MTFELEIAEERVKPHQITALHIIAAMALFTGGALFYFMRLMFAYSIFRDVSDHALNFVKAEGLIMAGVGLALLAVIVLKHRWLLQPPVNRAFRVLEIILTLSVALYAFSVKFVAPAATFGLLALVLLLSVFWEKNATTAIKVRIDEQGVRLPPNTKKRSLPWAEIEGILLRYGTLSVNCTDNTMHQWSMGVMDIDNKEFEDFCHKLIEENRGKRRKDDW